MSEAEPVDHQPWPLRALLLLALGAALALAVHLLTRGAAAWQWTESPARLGASAALAAGGIVFAFSLERQRWLWSVLFAIGSGLVVGFVTYWNGHPDSWGAGEGWQLTSALLALVIAVPIFQAARDAGRWNLDYRAVHGHILTNIVLWFVGWGFVLVTFLLILLLSELFQLIGIVVLRDLLNKEWVPWPLVGGALGAAVGLLRDRDRIVDTLQRVATAILSFLAPILAVGLVLFVLALPFTGLEPLWEQTKATTPILLVCILGAVVLINAVIGNGAEEDEARPRIVRWAAGGLAAVVLPLALVAAVSTSKRIAQHGFTPDRLWAAVFVAITVAGAAGYLFAVIRGRARWPALLRTVNLRLALGICLIALFLALPIVSFGAISTRDQLARLESGRIPPDKFDWAAMRFDFGPAGRNALERLKVAGRSPQIRKLAATVLASRSRYDDALVAEAEAAKPSQPAPLRLKTGTGQVPQSLLRLLYQPQPDQFGEAVCTGPAECLLFWKPGERTAVAIRDGCAPSVVGPGKQASRDVDCSLEVYAFEQGPKGWRALSHIPVIRRPLEPQKPLGSPEDTAGLRAERQAIDRGDVVIREVRHRQIFIGGKPAGQVFE